MKIEKIKEKICYLWIILLSFALPAVSLAGPEVDPKLKPPFKEGSGINTLVDFINFILNNIVLPIGAVVAVFFLVYSGFLFVTARGSVDKLETAKNTFLWTVIGVAVLLGATAISLAIQGTICEIANVPGLCNPNP